jgi:hypothetical protein
MVFIIRTATFNVNPFLAGFLAGFPVNYLDTPSSSSYTSAVNNMLFGLMGTDKENYWTFPPLQHDFKIDVRLH